MPGVVVALYRFKFDEEEAHQQKSDRQRQEAVYGGSADKGISQAELRQKQAMQAKEKKDIDEQKEKDRQKKEKAAASGDGDKKKGSKSDLTPIQRQSACFGLVCFRDDQQLVSFCLSYFLSNSARSKSYRAKEKAIDEQKGWMSCTARTEPCLQHATIILWHIFVLEVMYDCFRWFSGLFEFRPL